ncbi:MAG TPA: RelA/SpoT domain-containing protein [Clostridiaceae bacterium]
MSIIDEFMEIYSKEYDHYIEIARICAERCELELERNGIRAIVTHRGKRPDRLRLKLEKRIIEKNYKSIQVIYGDIVDFAGIRIALYFPGDRDEVNKLIESNFYISKVKRFPKEGIKNTYSKRFSGYFATHYICALKKDEPYEEDSRYVNSMVEIQVASVLMHAWAEVEHDLVYKPLNGDLSEDEYELLDQLNGLVMSGEISLERLQKAVKTRVAAIDKQIN